MAGKLILIGGYCATGKSTTARALGRRLNIACLDKDTLKETIAEPIGRENAAAIAQLSAATFAAMLHIADRTLQAGGALILESNFRQAELARIDRLLREREAQCLLFLFLADLDRVYDRYLARQQSGERHWVHAVAGGNREAFKAGQIPLGAVEMGFPTIRVDATDFENVDYESLFRAAEDFLWPGAL